MFPEPIERRSPAPKSLVSTSPKGIEPQTITERQRQRPAIRHPNHARFQPDFRETIRARPARQQASA